MFRWLFWRPLSERLDGGGCAEWLGSTSVFWVCANLALPLSIGRAKIHKAIFVHLFLLTWEMQ